MNNTLDYQSRDRKIDSLYFMVFEVPSPYDAIVGVTLNLRSLTHSPSRFVKSSLQDTCIVNVIYFQKFVTTEMAQSLWYSFKHSTVDALRITSLSVSMTIRIFYFYTDNWCMIDGVILNWLPTGRSKLRLLRP